MNRTLDDAHNVPPMAQPLAPWDGDSSMLDHEFSDLDIQTLFAVVQRAQDVLPSLPAHSRRPVPALFKAYYEILPQRGIDPEDDQQIAKLIFKLGGVKSGASLEEKFTAVMSRMGIELQLDDLQSHASDTEGEDAPMPDLPALEQAHRGPVYEVDEMEDDTPNDTMIPQPTYTGLSVIEEESHTHESTLEVDDDYNDDDEDDDDNTTEPEEPVAVLTEDELHETAKAFHNEHKFEFPVTTAFTQWHNRAAFASHILTQFQLARQADLEDGAEDKFQEWRSVAIEAQEIPLYELPGNIFSKQTEQVAARAREIYAMKSTLQRWRQRARRSKPQDGATPTVQYDLLRRVAAKAHDNLMLSRAFAKWYNRAGEECNKERLARHAYETNLKAKLFDVRRDPPPPPVLEIEQPSQSHSEELSKGSRPRMQFGTHAPAQGVLKDPSKSAVDAPASRPRSLVVDVKHNPGPASKVNELSSKPPTATHRTRHDRPVAESAVATGTREERDEERRKAEERRSVLKARTLSLIRALSERTQKSDEDSVARHTDGRIVKSEGDVEADGNADVTVVPIEDELDERTLVARRHILRMRYFTAWEEYTQRHLALVDTFPRQQTVSSWRRRAALAPETLQYVRQRTPESRQRAIRKWAKRIRSYEQLGEKAEWVHQRSRRSQTIAHWLAISCQRKRLTMLKRQALSAWYDQPAPDATLAACADEFHAFHQIASTLNAWRRAAARESLACDRLEQYGKRAGWYHAATSALRAWKAVSKETSRKIIAQKSAVTRWTAMNQREIKRQELLRDYADRAMFYNNVVKILPLWRARAKEVSARRQEQESYCDRASYYYSTKGALDAWSAKAKERRKHRLRSAHLETRRIVKKGAGERAVRTWHRQLSPQLRRTETMYELLDNALADRWWQQSVRAVHVWRDRAVQKQAVIDDKEAVAKQQTMAQWQLLAEEKQELSYEARTHWEDAACAKALKRWNLRRDQNAGRPSMVAYALEKKDRRMLRYGLERWYAKTAEHHLALETAEQQNSVSQLGTSTFDEAVTNSKGKSPARSESRWRVSLGEANRVEEVYVPTPGRPSLMLGDFGLRNALTTTPLGPVPRRSWHPDTHASSMRGSTVGGGTGRARKNLRVSFAR